MNVTIQQAQEDNYGNVKENIFHAFDEKKQYIGTGYVYPTINYHQTNETPYLIFLDINVQEHPKAEEARQLLFDAIMNRAEELRKEKTDMKCRIYAGFEWNPDKMEFYLKNGFEEDYSIIMEADLHENRFVEVPAEIRVEEFEVLEEESFQAYKKQYDEIFVTPLDEGFVEAQKEDQTFKNFNCYRNDELIGAFSVRLEEGCGWIEVLYVLEKYRGKGNSKLMMEVIHQYFREHGIDQAKLEVWELNRRAVRLYESYGYHEVQKTCMFPGKTV